MVSSLQNCRSRLGCKEQFEVYYYITNEQTLPSTSGNGYMNTGNYDLLDTIRISGPSGIARPTRKFTLQPGQTGFYLAVRDPGSCLAVSRIRVYRHNCISQQVGLVNYPDTPSPASSDDGIETRTVMINCSNENAAVDGSDTVTCLSNGTWGPENPVCGCNPGYEINGDECDSKLYI